MDAQSTFGEAVTSTCVTPNTPDEANCRKKPRLGWGEGLAKYEKKKVDSDEVSSSEYLPADRSPSLTGNPASVSPIMSFSRPLTPDIAFTLENFDATEGFNLSSLLDELLQIDDTSAPWSGFAMDKLQVWKADISRALEITESEIDSLEHELKSDQESCSFSLTASLFLKQCSNKNTEIRNTKTCIPMRDADVLLEEMVSSERAECSQDVFYDRDDKLYNSVLGSNKVIANRRTNELGKLLPTTQLHTGLSRATDGLEIKERFHMRKRVIKFKEQVTALKFRTLRYSWRESLRSLSVSSSAKSQYKFDHQKHRASNHSRSSCSGGSLSLVPTKEVLEYASMLLSDSRVKTYKNISKMPAFILDKNERMRSRFISDNGFVENPIDVEKERAIFNCWTVGDRETFWEKLALFGKNFRKIASFVPHKTVADCVEFYYKNHKSEPFQKTKKSKSSKVKSRNMYLVTSEKRPNQQTGSTSHDMLGTAVSAINGTVDCSMLEHQSKAAGTYCNEQETAAADVLAGICGYISSEALGSCVTSSVDHQKAGSSSKRRSLNGFDERTHSDDIGGEEKNSLIWSDEEGSSFVNALRSYGKDFPMISRCMGTKSSDECNAFFIKTRKCLGLDAIDLETGSEGTTGPDQTGDGSDEDGAFMVDSRSSVSNDSSSTDCDMDVEHAESGRIATTHNFEAEIKLGESSSNVNLEGADDNEAANLNEFNELIKSDKSPQNTCGSDSASGAKVGEPNMVARESEHELPSTVRGLSPISYYSRNSPKELTADHGSNSDFDGSNSHLMPNLFPKDPERKTRTHNDVSSSLTFRKSSQTPTNADGSQTKLNLDESLLLPGDGCLQTDTSSADIKKPNSSGYLKLFGKIIVSQESEKSSSSRLEKVTTFN